MPRKPANKFVFDEKKNPWFGGQQLALIKKWMERVKGEKQESVDNESTRAKKKSKKK